MKTNQTPTAAFNIKEWMWGLGEDASEAEVRNDEGRNHRTEQKNAYFHHLEDDTEDKVPHDYWETLPVDLPL